MTTCSSQEQDTHTTYRTIGTFKHVRPQAGPEASYWWGVEQYRGTVPFPKKLTGV
jgi:hypothetical protein